MFIKCDTINNTIVYINTKYITAITDDTVSILGNQGLNGVYTCYKLNKTSMEKLLQRIDEKEGIY